MSEIKTIDDLIDYLDDMTETLAKIRSKCKLDLSSEFFGGNYVSYLDASKKAKELKANMEKQND